ncbi:hypothetical protein GIW70_07605 [Pseudomonas syringae]|nr:hypothetical protein [Pseudomonas syringae]MCF5068061.1 hypothetical protein [Pseudomonas syringae]
MHPLMKDVLDSLGNKNNVRAGSISFTFKGKDFRVTDIGLIPFPGRHLLYGLGEGEFNGSREGIIITLPPVYDTTRPLLFTTTAGEQEAGLLPSVEGFSDADVPIGGPGFQFGILESTFACDRIKLINGKVTLI